MNYTPFFSVVMASYLGNYAGAASNRINKFIRAIDCMASQSFTDWELIIVSDGCKKTVNYAQKYTSDSRIRVIQINKQPKWSGHIRNVGHNNAKGQWITYLDTDDVIGTNHLQKIYEGIFTNPDACCVFYNDCLPTKIGNKYQFSRVAERPCEISMGKCGTSNISFIRSLPVRWNDNTYLHDWKFIESLIPFNPVRIAAAEYVVCHVPNLLDV